MVEVLRWVDATRAHQYALQHFTCADPDGWQYPTGRRSSRQKFHPEEWALVVQLGLRDMRPPVPKGRERALLLFAGDNLAAIAWYERGSEPNSAFMKALAVDCRYQGKELGRHAMRFAFAQMVREPWCDPELPLYVWGRVHQENLASQAVCTSVGMVRLTRESQPPYEDWAVELPPLVDTVAPEPAPDTGPHPVSFTPSQRPGGVA